MEEKKQLRKFGLTSLAVDNATSIFILTIMILFFGYSAYRNMPKEQYPEVNFPRVAITTSYFGNSAADIENLITRPLEKELMGMKDVDVVTSSSRQDFSIILVEFDFSVEDSEDRVKDAVDKARPELPDDLTVEPQIDEFDVSEQPVMVVNISGDFGADELRGYAEHVQEKLEAIKEVRQVDLLGAQDREVKINVDLPRMESLQVSFGDIENAIRSENVTMSGGEVLQNGFRRSIRVVGEFETAKDIENIIVKSENQNPIYLRDIATVIYGFKDRTSIARANGLPVIALEVVKRSGENILVTADKINAVVEEQLFVGLAIPVSMLTGILWLSISGLSINMMVLFALILALGLLVDNAIVVVENIYRYRQEGYSGREAAKYGTGEVALPIIASTATTLAAFIPLIFWPGIMGEFMKYLPITLIIVLSSSLFVALVINPVFTSRFLKVDERLEDATERRSKLRNVLIGALIMLLIGVVGHLTGIDWLRNLMGFAVGITLINHFILRPASFAFQRSGIPFLERVYNKFIRFVLRIPALVFLGTIGLLFGAIVLLNMFMPKVVFFSEADPLYVNAFVELPMGKED